ncbi:MAG: VWA domain-containing protein, partial [Desulfobacterales bacterium]|nr:VWA domain-containing protein [Desulfobacterales bacterium]
WEAEPPASASPPPESGELSARGEGPPVHAPKKSTWRKPSTSGLRAGFADDNKQFNYFLQFLDQYRHQGPHYAINIQERIVLKVRDENGNSAPNSKIEIYAGNEKLCEGLTYSDGSFLFFPLEYDRPVSRYKVVVTRGRRSKTLHLDRWGRRLVHITLPFRKGGMQSAPLDILFIMDTTGSMGEEIERLKKTLEIIKLNLASLSSRPTIRFGMVLYKDRGDVYVT